MISLNFFDRRLEFHTSKKSHNNMKKADRIRCKQIEMKVFLRYLCSNRMTFKSFSLYVRSLESKEGPNISWKLMLIVIRFLFSHNAYQPSFFQNKKEWWRWNREKTIHRQRRKVLHSFTQQCFVFKEKKAKKQDRIVIIHHIFLPKKKQE